MRTVDRSADSRRTSIAGPSPFFRMKRCIRPDWPEVEWINPDWINVYPLGESDYTIAPAFRNERCIRVAGGKFGDPRLTQAIIQSYLYTARQIIAGICISQIWEKWFRGGLLWTWNEGRFEYPRYFTPRVVAVLGYLVGLVSHFIDTNSRLSQRLSSRELNTLHLMFPDCKLKRCHHAAGVMARIRWSQSHLPPTYDLEFAYSLPIGAISDDQPEDYEEED